MATKENSATAKNLRDIFVDGLKDIYWAENALVKSLPKIFENATDIRLKTAIKDHLAQTKEHVSKLEKVFECIGEGAEGKKCLAMEGILKEGDEMLQETEEGAVRDAAIIASSQKVEHYEITSYGTLVAYAKSCGKFPKRGNFPVHRCYSCAFRRLTSMRHHTSRRPQVFPVFPVRAQNSRIFNSFLARLIYRSCILNLWPFLDIFL